MKEKLEHAKDKQFDNLCCKIKTEEVFKGKSNEPVVEGTTFGWVIHGGNYTVEKCLYTTEVSDYKKLCSLDVLGIEDRRENDQDEVVMEFTENIARKADGRYEVNIQWMEGSELRETNFEQSKRRLRSVDKHLIFSSVTYIKCYLNFAMTVGRLP